MKELKYIDQNQKQNKTSNDQNSKNQNCDLAKTQNQNSRALI